jgi:hypothetical protein
MIYSEVTLDILILTSHDCSGCLYQNRAEWKQFSCKDYLIFIDNQSTRIVMVDS